MAMIMAVELHEFSLGLKTKGTLAFPGVPLAIDIKDLSH
jgi:hypothetical protein